ncbi:MAG: acetyltransferase [Linnemannia gamsii]|nr:MAG: acetyltransferase [Linnemannia gamsii]
MSCMNLRQATPDDASVLAELGALTFTHTFGQMYTSKDLQDYITTTYTVEQHLIPLTDSRESFWLLEDENGQAMAFGWVGACKLPVPNLESNAGEIKRLYVHPDHQGKKLGSRILKRMLDWLGDEGFGPLYIGVWSENYGAQRLYARYGFEKVSEYEFVVGNHRDHEFILKRS